MSLISLSLGLFNLFPIPVLDGGLILLLGVEWLMGKGSRSSGSSWPRSAREFGVISPPIECGITKADVRELSRRHGLPTWDKPASACLASRIPLRDGGHVGEAANDRARAPG